MTPFEKFLSPKQVNIDIPTQKSSSVPGAENTNPNIPKTHQTVKR